MKKVMALALVLLAFGMTTACVSLPKTSENPPAADYQKLLGKWIWTYELGYAILTIEKVAPAAGGGFVLIAVYENYNPSWGSDTIGKGRKMMGRIDTRKNPAEIILGKDSIMELTWDGKNRLSGYARLSGWSGNVDFRKKK